MGRTYKRTTQRAVWSDENLKRACEAITSGSIKLWAASKAYKIPYPTLKRRLETPNFVKGSPGPSGCLGRVNEKSFVQYIKKLQESGFPTRGVDIRRLTYFFVEQNEISHRFCKKKKTAGYDWLQLFLKRNPEVAIRKAQGISIARDLGMNRFEVDKYFSLLLTVLEKNDMMNSPGRIYNMDECGLQLNNEPGKVIAMKGSRDVHHVTSAEKGETITLVACCNAEGKFLLPYCIFKGQRKKPEFQDGMPPGSFVQMNEASAYVNTDIFLHWLQSHFIPRKEPGIVLLILDGHRSHCSDVTVLDFAANNDVILLCLPSHTTQYLQPLNRSFFKSLKTFWQQTLNNWMHTNPGRKLSRLQFGSLLCAAWNKAATVGNGTAGFSACGIYPYNPQKIPEHAFLMSDNAEEHTAKAHSETEDPNTSTSKQGARNEFEEISPIPNIQKPKPTGRKKQSAEIMTTEEKREEMKRKKTVPAKPKGKRNQQKRKTKLRSASSSSSIQDIVVGSSDDDDVDYEDFCVEYKGYYYDKKGPKCDWIECIKCKKWLHDICSKDSSSCNKC